MSQENETPMPKPKSKHPHKLLSEALFVYTQPINARYAKDYGKKNFGSYSKYVDKLIQIDRKKGYSKAHIEADSGT